jgi:hypothetical protein
MRLEHLLPQRQGCLVATTGIRSERSVLHFATRSGMDPCLRRMTYGALRPMDYCPSLIDRLVSRWSRLR